MSKVLYITANPKKVEDSYGLTVGEEFINEYKKNNPEDTVTAIDLFKLDISNVDKEIAELVDRVIKPDELDEEHKQIMQKMGNTVDEFIKHDKYVFVTPLWNLGVPPIVKTYFDNVCAVGKTFKYTETGAVGLLEGKKALHIQASGGIYSSGPMAPFEHGASYIKSILNFFGIHDVKQLFIEGVSIQQLDHDKIKQDAIDTAKVLAKTF